MPRMPRPRPPSSPSCTCSRRPARRPSRTSRSAPTEPLPEAVAVTLYPLIPLTTCIVTATLAVLILARDASRRANRLAALLVGGRHPPSRRPAPLGTPTQPPLPRAPAEAPAPPPG